MALTPAQRLANSLRSPVLRDTPPEWEAVPPEQAALLRPKGGIYTLDQHRQLEAIARKRWFLLRNTGPEGKAWRCTRCHRVHEYFTLHCIERPYNGLTYAVGIMAERLGPDVDYFSVALGAIVPISREAARARYERLRALGYSAAELLGTGAPAAYTAEERRALLG